MKNFLTKKMMAMMPTANAVTSPAKNR